MTIRHLARNIVRFAFAMGIVVVLCGVSPAAPVIYEPFDYDTNPDVIENLTGQNGGLGFEPASAWGATKRYGRVLEGSITWGDLEVTGGRAASERRSSPYRSIGTTLADAGLMDNGATLWFSYIEDVFGQNMTNLDYSFALTTEPFDNDYNERQNLTNNGSGIGVSNWQYKICGAYWLDNGDGDGVGERTYIETGVEMDSADNSRILMVGKIQWGADDLAPERLTLYTPNTDLELGEPVLDAWETAALDQSQFDTLAIGWKDSEATMDEIRIGATYEDVIANPPPPPALSLQVNPFTGATAILGDDLEPVSIKYYEIQSDDDSLDVAGWSSLTDQDFEGSGPPDGTGDGWEEAGGSGAHALAEGYLLGESAIGALSSVSLGKAFDESENAQDLVFRYRTAEGKIVTAGVAYDTLDPDIDGDGSVDDADLGLLLSGYDPLETGDDGAAPYSPAELEILLASYGWTSSASAAEVPEPASMVLLLLGALGLLGLRRRK